MKDPFDQRLFWLRRLWRWLTSWWPREEKIGDVVKKPLGHYVWHDQRVEALEVLPEGESLRLTDKMLVRLTKPYKDPNTGDNYQPGDFLEVYLYDLRWVNPTAALYLQARGCDVSKLRVLPDPSTISGRHDR